MRITNRLKNASRSPTCFRDSSTLCFSALSSLQSFTERSLNSVRTFLKLIVSFTVSPCSLHSFQILNSSSTSTEKNPSSTFESNTSQPSLGTLLSHSIDGTLSISFASSLIKSEQSEAQEDETKVRQLIAEKSESRRFYLKSLNKQTQTQTQTQTQRKIKVMKTFLIEKLEDGNDYKGVWGSYRSDGVDLFETREIE